MKQKLLRWCGTAALVLLALGMFSFLRAFTRSESAVSWVDWQSAAILTPDGTERPLTPEDLYQGPPELGPGELLVFRAVLDDPGDGDLLLEISGAEMALTLNGVPLLASESVLPEGAPGLAQARFPLPPDVAGQTVELRCRPLEGQTFGVFPPALRLISSAREETETIAYANLYAMPAAVLAAAFLLVCFLFFMGLLTDGPDWTLPLLAVAAAALSLHHLAVGLGYRFLSPMVNSLLGWAGFESLIPALLLAYLALNRKKAFWRRLGLCTLVSGGVLLCCWLISQAQGGYLASYLAILADGALHGSFRGLLYWLTAYLTAVCALLAAWGAVDTAARRQAEANALALKAELAVQNCRAIEEHDRQAAALRHELNHHIVALNAMYQEGRQEELGAYLAALRSQSDALPQVRFTDNITVNAILQDAAARAAAENIQFDARAAVPERLSIPERDLCGLLMNLLDNALEGAAKAPENQFIRFHCQMKNGFLGVKCENSYAGPLSADPETGQLRSTKPDPGLHGFGIAQMRQIAEKYHSLLDISYTDQVFMVQAALKPPETP